MPTNGFRLTHYFIANVQTYNDLKKVPVSRQTPLNCFLRKILDHYFYKSSASNSTVTVTVKITSIIQPAGLCDEVPLEVKKTRLS